jgi:DNA-binding transcriptional regulator LsrR (DeoR family)
MNPVAEKQLENDHFHARLVNRILTMYYIQDLTQLQIAQKLGLSTTKVNRLLQFARKNKMVEFSIKTLFQHLFDVENQLQNCFSLQDTWVIPLEGNEISLRSIGDAGASFLLSHLQDGDVIAIGGGTTIQALVESVVSNRKYQVDVVPMVGGIQGQPTTDVNYLASQLAERLGGRAFQLYSPAFVETPEHRDALLRMAPIKEILDIARKATISLFGIGTVDPNSSRFVQFTALSPEEMNQIAQLHCGVGEILAIVYDIDGDLCAPEYADRVVGLTFEELKQIPLRIGVAGTETKTRAIYGALRGGHLSCIVTDEAAAESVIDFYHSRKDIPLPSRVKEAGPDQIQELTFNPEG